MLLWPLVLLVASLIAGLLGFSLSAGAVAEVARILFLIFLFGSLLAFIATRRPPPAT